MPATRYRIACLRLAGASMAVAVLSPVTPAQAIIVFDPSTYGQTVLTAARTLTQINNQIRMLQNQAQSLINQAKNLSTIGFPELGALTQTIRQIDRLMDQARGIEFRVSTLDAQFNNLFPANIDRPGTLDARLATARSRLETSMSAYRQTMAVQAQVVENVTADTQTLNSIVARSQAAVGSLQATQATNQLLALNAKQQLQIQNLMAAQYRAEALEHARAVQSQAEARAATARFLGSGTAYTPH